MSDTRNADIPVLILCGGFGTRLREVTGDGQKCVAGVAGRPFIYYLLDQIAEQRFSQVILCVGYQYQQVKELIGEEYRGLSISYSLEAEPLGTGGAVVLALQYIHAEEVLVMNGDSYCQVDLYALLANSQRTRSPATMVVRMVEDTSRYGKVTINDAGLIKQFSEKTASSGPGLINAGIYLLRKELVTQILEQDEVSSLEQDFFPQICDGRLAAFLAPDSTFIDIGTPASFATAQSVFNSEIEQIPNDLK